jgi:hypothetical protein
VRRQEKQLHIETLEELSVSFEEEVTPLVVEIAGVQHRLTGTAAVQYAEWRDLLRQMYISETGFVPEDVAIYAEPEPVPALEEAATGAAAEVPTDASSEATATGETTATGEAAAVPASETETAPAGTTPAEAAETTPAPQPNAEDSSTPPAAATDQADGQGEDADASGGSASGV